jgi:hypothetical protein
MVFGDGLLFLLIWVCEWKDSLECHFSGKTGFALVKLEI